MQFQISEIVKSEKQKAPLLEIQVIKSGALSIGKYFGNVVNRVNWYAPGMILGSRLVNNRLNQCLGKKLIVVLILAKGKSKIRTSISRTWRSFAFSSSHGLSSAFLSYLKEREPSRLFSSI